MEYRRGPITYEYRLTKPWWRKLRAPAASGQQLPRCDDDGRRKVIAMAGNRTHGMSVRNLMWYSGIIRAWGTMAIPWATLAQAVKSRNILWASGSRAAR